MEKNKQRRILLHLLGLLIGFLIGYFAVFQGFFLAKVLPHGGI